MEEKDVKIIQNIFEICKDIEDEDTREVMIFQIQKGLELLEAKKSNKPLDISEQIDMVTNILGISLRDLVQNIINDMNMTNSGIDNAENINENTSDEEVLKFLSEIDDTSINMYKEKLKELKEL